MSDQDMKLNVEVKTTSDTSGLDKAERELAVLKSRVAALGNVPGVNKLTGQLDTLTKKASQFGKLPGTKGLEAALVSNAKMIEKVNKTFGVSEALIERIEKKFIAQATAGKISANAVGGITREINKMGRALEGVKTLNKADHQIYKDKVSQARAMVSAIQKVGETQRNVAGKRIGLLGQIRDLVEKAELGSAAAAKKQAERQRQAENAALRMGQTDQRLLLDKLSLQERIEAGRRIARENELRHERFLDGGRRRREAEIARIERQARNRSNAGLDNRIGARNLLDQVQGQTARLSTRLGYRGSIEGNLGARALGEYRDGAAKALRSYRSQMRDLRSVPLDQYDPKAETRVQKRLRTERQGLYAVFQEKMAFAREEQRVYDRSDRDRLRAIREQERAYQRLKNEAVGGFNQFRYSGAQMMGAARQPAMLGAAVGAAGIAAGLKGIAGRMSVDTAETSLQIFGSDPFSRKPGSGTNFTKEDVKAERRGWLDAAALDNGINASTGLNAFTEVIKAGVDNKKRSDGSSLAQNMTKMLLDAGSGMDMPLDEITKVMGKIAQNVPGVDEKRMKSILNSMAISAATTAADPNQIVAGMRRGMGVFSMSNMTPETLAGYTAVGAGAGIQEGKTGNFIAELVSTVMTAGKQHGQRKKDLNVAARALGFGSAQGLSNAGSVDADAAIDKLLGNFSRLSKAQQSLMAQKLGGREWDDEILQFVNSIEKLRDVKSAINDPRNKNFLDDAQAKRMSSWQGKWNKAKAVISLAWESIGTGFDDIYNQALDYFTVSGGKFDFGQISSNVQSFLKGFVKGLGFDNVTSLLESVLGKAGQQKLDYVNQLQAFGKGLAEGLKSVSEAVKGLLTAFTGGSQDPEVIGRLTGRIVGLSAALLVLSPVIAVLGALASGISMIAGAAKGIGALLGLSRMAATVGAASSGAAAVAGSTVASRMAASSAISNATAAGGGVASRLGTAVFGTSLTGLGARILGGIGLAIVAEIGSNRGQIATMLGAPEIGRVIKDSLLQFIKDVYQGVRDAMTPAGIRSFLRQGVEQAFPGFATPRAGNPDNPGDAKHEIGRANPDWSTVMPQYATGGHISGPGNGTSDSILARLSNGEYVVNAAATQQHRGLLEAINGGLPAFATGGPIGGSGSSGNGFSYAKFGYPGERPSDISLLIRKLDDLCSILERESGVRGHRSAARREFDAFDRVFASSASQSPQQLGSRLNLAALSAGPLQAGAIVRSAAGGSGPAAAGLGEIRGAGGATALYGAIPGQALPGTGFGRRGIIGGGGDGSASGMPDPGTGAGVGPYKPILDHIAGTEGTARAPGGGYNTSLGYGKFLPGGQEQNLTGKSLNEILALGNHMRRQPRNPNSSALGRYQIVGKTLRGLMGKLHLSGNEKFDEAMQDRLGAELVRGRGANPAGLGQEWASLRGDKLARAVQLAQGIPSGSSTAPGERGTSADIGGGNVLGRMQALRTVNEQCVSLAKAAVGSTESVLTWQKGAAANEGTLKPGTPVATFLDRQGRQSERYAGGGTGTPGAHLDHAGVFEKYLVDKEGKNIGMRIAEQYQGSGGVHSKDYLFGKGYGEGNGSNYNAIKDKAGRYLGGDLNPMNRNENAGSEDKGFTSTGWKKAGAEDLVAESPAEKLARSAPKMPQAGGAADGGARVTAPITIQNNGNAEHTANQVQRRIQDVSGYHSQDRSYESI